MRIWIRGSTAAGKSTLARELAEKLDCPYIELDDLWWLPGWKERTPEELGALVEEVTSAESWVMSGNYRLVTEPIALPRCDVLIWLDYSFPCLMGRILRRTHRRIVRKELCCNGNRERLWIHLTPKGLPWWLIVSYARRRHQCRELMARTDMPHIRLVRVRHPAELDTAIQSLE